MKLFYSPGTCSLAPHLVLREIGKPFELDRVDMYSKKTESGSDLGALSPAATVPLLQLDSGAYLSECAVILQYLADTNPQAQLAAPPGTPDRWTQMQWLNTIATEVHKGFSAVFNDYGDAARTKFLERIGRYFGFFNSLAGKNAYLLGSRFSIVDAYLFPMIVWSRIVEIDASSWPDLVSYFSRVAARKSVKDAMEAEGLADMLAEISS